MSVDTDPIAGKVVLLAGASGEVGGALAQHLQSRGARLGIAVRRPRQVAELTEVFGREGILIGCVPTGDSEAAAGLVKGVGDALGPIAALLSTAGAFAMAGIGQDPADELQAMLDANLLVNTSLARAVIGPMKRRRTGSLVFTGARAVASAGGAGMANYLASKAALHEYVRALAGELAGSGVRAAAVLPGTIDTANNRKAMPDADRSGWLRVDAVVQALVTCAFGTPDGPGPLYPVSG